MASVRARACSREHLRGNAVDPARHFGSGAARERQQHHAARIGAVDDQMRHPVGQRVGFARAGASDDQKRAGLGQRRSTVLDGAALLRVELCQIRGVHCGRFGRGRPAFVGNFACKSSLPPATHHRSEQITNRMPRMSYGGITVHSDQAPGRVRQRTLRRWRRCRHGRPHRLWRGIAQQTDKQECPVHLKTSPSSRRPPSLSYCGRPDSSAPDWAWLMPSR